MLNRFVLNVRTPWHNFVARQKAFRMPWWGWILVVVCAAAISQLPGHIIISTTPSTKATFFWRGQLRPDNAVPGQYVTFEHLNPWIRKEKPILFVKRIGCGPGQVITRNAMGDFYCNGDIYLGRALKADSKGNRLTITDFVGVIPPGKFFITGDHPRSFDSKYYGLISYSEMKEHASPLF